MPWTEKQLRLFRATAHNPEIAKRTGIKQADAERMSKEGLKKAVGGAIKQKILKQDTRHGKVDMPFTQMNRLAGMKKGGLMRSKRDIGKDQMDMAPYKKGGEMKESKAMMKKEIDFFKKKGAPASMIRHEEAEAKSEGMKRGGMAKYARGGGIESRGKTKGTMVKMAGGGFVRSADGIAQRGKTKATQITMRKGGKC